MKQTIIRSIIMVVLCAAILIAMNYVSTDNWSTPSDPMSTVAGGTTAAQETTYPPLEGMKHEPWGKLQKKYKDIVGYIKIGGESVAKDGIAIEDVVVQYKDNDYYLRKNAAGEYQYDGCYFADCRCVMDLCQNTTIYGHNMDNTTTKFGQLEKYRDLKMYQKYPIIYFDTPATVGVWKIVAVFLTNDDEADGVKFYYRDRDYPTQEEFLYYIERCRRRSYIDCPVDVQANDRLLTLSTCDYSLSNSKSRHTGRLVVVARQVRPGESTTVDVAKAKYNPNPLLPEGYYRRYGGKMPHYDDEPLL